MPSFDINYTSKVLPASERTRRETLAIGQAPNSTTDILTVAERIERESMVAGPNYVPNPAVLPNGQILVTQDGEYVAADLPDGTGDMHSLIYDPDGKRTNAFNLANLSGTLDGGVF